MHLKLCEELAYLNLGDSRRKDRFARIVQQQVSNPGISIMAAGYSWSDIKMTYRFYSNDSVDPGAISACIQKATVDRCMGNAVVLSVQDTTSINFSSSAEGLGYLDHGMGEGLMLHNTLVLDEMGCPLGLLDQQIWARDKAEMGKRKTRHQRPIEEKESYRWIQSMQHVSTMLKEHPKVVHIADREADIYELFTAPRPAGAELLIRCTHDRKTLWGNDMWQEIAAEKPLATFSLSLSKASSEQIEEVTMEVKASMVLMAPPVHKGSLPSLTMYGLMVRQINSAESNALEWKLVSTLPITNREEAIRAIRWYSYRWRIERFHYILKSGCRLEDLQLRSVKALKKAVVIYSLSAFKLMQLLYQSRQQPEQSCEHYLDEQEWKLLLSIHSKSPVIQAKPPTLQQSIILIGRLGGYLARSNDGPPGIKNLWRGLQKLNIMLNAINLNKQWFSTT